MCGVKDSYCAVIHAVNVFVICLSYVKYSAIELHLSLTLCNVNIIKWFTNVFYRCRNNDDLTSDCVCNEFLVLSLQHLMRCAHFVIDVVSHDWLISYCVCVADADSPLFFLLLIIPLNHQNLRSLLPGNKCDWIKTCSVQTGLNLWWIIFANLTYFAGDFRLSNIAHRRNWYIITASYMYL